MRPGECWSWTVRHIRHAAFEEPLFVPSASPPLRRLLVDGVVTTLAIAAVGRAVCAACPRGPTNEYRRRILPFLFPVALRETRGCESYPTRTGFWFSLRRIDARRTSLALSNGGEDTLSALTPVRSCRHHRGLATVEIRWPISRTPTDQTLHENTLTATTDLAYWMSSSRSGVIFMPTRRSASRKSVRLASSPTALLPGASRFTAASARRGSSGCFAGRPQARAASAFAPTWTRCLSRRRRTFLTCRKSRAHARLLPCLSHTCCSRRPISCETRDFAGGQCFFPAADEGLGAPAMMQRALERFPCDDNLCFAQPPTGPHGLVSFARRTMQRPMSSISASPARPHSAHHPHGIDHVIALTRTGEQTA